MTPPTIAFFNNKGGVGKTSLVYHLAWMYADLGLRVLAVDLDPQANLTAVFLAEERIEELWGENSTRETVFGSVSPLLEGVGDISRPHAEQVADHLRLLPGDLALSGFEDELSQQWPQAADGKERAFRVLSAFWRLIRLSGDEWNHDLALVDLGPNLGAINRAALIASDYVVLPVAADIYSIQGMKNLGPTVRGWGHQWRDRCARNPKPQSLELPIGNVQPIGYVVISPSVRLDRPVKTYAKWVQRISGTYRSAVLEETPGQPPDKTEDDPHCLATLKHYRSLMPLSQEAMKPVFHLRAADGALGGHEAAVRSAHDDFEKLARAIAAKVGLKMA
ncbi:ParA family protein [Candidatus Poribacteria bacterium]|nr:ParA family protein [Candidatus Poribacteria bacterium]